MLLVLELLSCCTFTSPNTVSNRYGPVRRNELLTPSAPLTSCSVSPSPFWFQIQENSLYRQSTDHSCPIRELPLEDNSLAQIRHSKESIKFDFTWYLLRNSAGDTLCSNRYVVYCTHGSSTSMLYLCCCVVNVCTCSYLSWHQDEKPAWNAFNWLKQLVSTRKGITIPKFTTFHAGFTLYRPW